MPRVRTLAEAGATPTGGDPQPGHPSGGYPTEAQSDNSRDGFGSALRRRYIVSSTRQLDAKDRSVRVRDYPAIAARTWVIDAGASNVVVPAGIAEAKSWDRVSLREPLGINTASGRNFSTHAVAPRALGAPEAILAADMPDTPMLTSVGRRCLNHGYSFAWLVGRAP